MELKGSLRFDKVAVLVEHLGNFLAERDALDKVVPVTSFVQKLCNRLFRRLNINLAVPYQDLRLQRDPAVGVPIALIDLIDSVWNVFDPDSGIGTNFIADNPIIKVVAGGVVKN